MFGWWRGTVVDEGDGSMEEDYEFSKGRGGVWAEKNEEGRRRQGRRSNLIMGKRRATRQTLHSPYVCD